MLSLKSIDDTEVDIAVFHTLNCTAQFGHAYSHFFYIL